MDLRELVGKWTVWSASADQSESGWEADFPEWAELIKAAAEAMKTHPREPIATAVGRSWALSEETEDLADVARNDNVGCWAFLDHLSRHPDPRVRWQVYASVNRSDAEGISLLRRGIDDPDPYVRRRALLALASVKAPESGDLAMRFVADEDPYLRQVALALASASGEKEVLKKIKSMLKNDPVEHVRRAATSDNT